MPKMKNSWPRYDTGFVEQCINEFDAADKKGFAFRYAGTEGDFVCLIIERFSE